ncbi:PAS domain S-box protein [Phycicoccus sp. HDW14]|uniref:PAS domain-containing sensor histidine kinase n=1 Tax=Phycicoccus sp. HDW14 TaxID=2714941 RepID=UPI001407630C|nr:PAS domain-containing sensor histidine kinase [Phycicoccus sp. HDW14]QIM20770.1 PAS domain S-box protein [Phycicoccus sp. HDW14]
MGDDRVPHDPGRTAATVPDLADADAWFREVVEGSPDGVLLVDDGVIRYVNRSLEQLSGWSREDLVGRSPEHLVPPRRRQRHVALRTAFAREPRPRPMGEAPDLELLRADGTTRAVEMALAPVAVGDRTLTVATVRDVSRRRVAEAERARLAHIVDLVPDSIVVVDLTTERVVEVNRAAPLLLGRPASELRGLPVAALAAGGSPVLLEDGRSLHEQLLRTGDGAVVECEVHARTISTPDGPRLVNVVRDVSGRLDLERRLRAQEESFRIAFDQAPVGIALTERDSVGERTILRANPAFTAMFGYEPGELDGRDPALLRPPGSRIGPGSTRPHDDLVDRTVVRPYARKDGSGLWAEVRASRLDSGSEERPRFLVHAVDVTDRVRGEQASRRHAAVTECIADVARAALEHRDEDGVFERIARGAAEALGADATAVLLVDRPDEPEAVVGGHRVVATSGPLTARLTGGLESPAGRRLVVDLLGPRSVAASLTARAADALGPEVGSLAAARFGTDGATPVGGILACRRHGDPPLTADDLDQLARLAVQSQMAVHLSRARADQERVILLEERQRIARELHDTVIQDVIALGMEISAEVDRERDPVRQARDLDRIARLEEVTRTLRRAVFQLRSGTHRGSLAREVAAVVGESERVLGHAPSITFSGSLDRLGNELAADLLGALREALSNVARHARAQHTGVAVRVVDDEVVLTVEDDGVGTEDSAPAGYGLHSMGERAERHDGSVRVGSGVGRGTRVEWRCPVRGEPPA